MLVTIPRDIAGDLTLLDEEKTTKGRHKKLLKIMEQYAYSRQLSDLVSYNEMSEPDDTVHSNRCIGQSNSCQFQNFTNFCVFYFHLF